MMIVTRTAPLVVAVSSSVPGVGNPLNTDEWDKVATALRTAGFPANRQDLVNHARQAQADDQTVALLRRLSVGIYRNLVDVRLRSDDQAGAARSETDSRT
jgi:Protein of unknown function (DUF2795)